MLPARATFTLDVVPAVQAAALCADAGREEVNRRREAVA
jgi:hypothetical protein